LCPRFNCSVQLARNKYVTVTNRQNSNSTVAITTYTVSANKGNAFHIKAWVAIGKPNDANTAKIELMR